MSGGSARSIRRHSLELWQDLVLDGIRKSTFKHLTVNWNFNVLEMAFKTFHFVQGVSRTPLLFIPRYLTNLFFENVLQKQESRESKIWKSKNPGSLTGAQHCPLGTIVASAFRAYGRRRQPAECGVCSVAAGDCPPLQQNRAVSWHHTSIGC